MPEPPTGRVGAHVEDADALRPRRAAADGGVPDEERAGPAHQPGEARLLGGAPAAGRAHPAAAADRARAAEGRGEAGRPDAAATARPPPRRQELRRLPPAASTRSAWCSRASARSASGATKDLGGTPGADDGDVPRRQGAHGLDGLRGYLREKRQDDFVDNLCRKLFAYALGRSLLLSDEATRREMRTRLAARRYAFGSLVEAIVTSPQFLNKRGGDRACGGRIAAYVSPAEGRSTSDDSTIKRRSAAAPCSTASA